MSSLQIPFQCSSSCSSQKTVHAYAAINGPKLPRVRISLPKIPTLSTKLVHEFNGSVQGVVPSQKDVIITTSRTFQDSCDPNKSKAIIQLHALLKTVADRAENHKIIGKQRNNGNCLLLNSINMMMVRLNTTVRKTAFKLTSILLLSAAKAMLLIKNKIQTSQRNATRLFKKLQTDFQTTLTRANPTEEDVNSAMKTSKFEPVTNDYQMKVLKSQKNRNNGWSQELEEEMREILEVVKRKDMEDCARRGNLALKINKTLAILGPLLTGIAAVGSALERHGSSWAGVVAVVAGSLADFVKALEGMVLEMYRNCGGFLKDIIEATLEEKDCEKRENGELFEKKVAMKLGRSVSQLRRLASKCAAFDSEGVDVDEFASNLF